MDIRHSSLSPLLVLTAALGGGYCHADERCAGLVVTEIRSLAELPIDLRQQLPGSTRGLSGIADRGRPFNATDVVDDDLPMQRFILGAVGPTCAVIAVEHGGRAHYFELTEYQLIVEGWHSVWHSTMFVAPKTVRDLLLEHQSAQ